MNKDEIKKIKGQRIRQIRKLQNLSQSQFAAIIDTDKYRVSNWENGRQGISIANIRKIKNAFGYNINEDIEGQIQRKLYKKELKLIKEEIENE